MTALLVIIAFVLGTFGGFGVACLLISGSVADDVRERLTEEARGK